MTNAQLIHQDSGKTEYYTPLPIIEAARRVMGGIDLDPASSAAANARVKAVVFFDKANDGLLREWDGRVWFNPPFSRKGNPLWVNKLETEYSSGRVTEACCITFACTSERWFQPLMRRPQCYLFPRTDYFDADGNKVRGVTKGSVVTYYGDYHERLHDFAKTFQHLGTIKVPYIPK
jgi:hypothetical protein